MKQNRYYEKKADERFKVWEGPMNYDMPLHFHRNVEMQYSLNQTYDVTVQGERLSLKKDDILIVPSRKTHGAPMQEKVREISLLVPYDFFSYFPAFQHSSQSFFVLTDKTFNRKMILPILRTMLRTEGIKAEESGDKENYEPSDTVALGWTNLLFGTLFSFYRLEFTGMSQSDSGFSEQILYFIDNNYMKPDLSLQTIAQTFGYNPSYLSRTFKKIFGVTLSGYIRSVRIQKFINIYPMQDNPNILSLALQCGFSAASAFYRAFFEETHTSPKEYFRVKQLETENEQATSAEEESDA